jgi:hypothetical protein
VKFLRSTSGIGDLTVNLKGLASELLAGLVP